MMSGEGSPWLATTAPPSAKEVGPARARWLGLRRKGSWRGSGGAASMRHVGRATFVELRKPGVSAMSCVGSMPSARKRPGADTGLCLCLHQGVSTSSHHPGGGGGRVLEVELDESGLNFQMYSPVCKQRALQEKQMQDNLLQHFPCNCVRARASRL